MGMNDTPSGERVHIGFFGRRNAGKSSVVNAVTGQNLAIVSDKKGTTTDPVYKAMELLPLGPVLIIDTPGFDDTGALGELRVERTRQVLNKTDIAVLVIDAAEGMQQSDRETLALIREKGLPYIIVYNKSDLTKRPDQIPEDVLYVSARDNTGIHELKERLARLKPQDAGVPIVRDMVRPGDFFVLVVPVDSAAPKGRLILPQQQAIRDVLEAGAIAVVVREHELAAALDQLGNKAAMVITDSQAFSMVGKITPDSIPLTSFSILMANYKGFLKTAVAGVSALKNLQDGDTVLIAEGCTHHRQCNDIGTVKLPNWLQQYTGKSLNFQFCSGTEFPENLAPYSMVIHCGGCMLNHREIQYRMRTATDQSIPFTNYGTIIALITGTLARSLCIFPEIHEML